MFYTIIFSSAIFYIFYIMICINYPPHHTCIVSVSNTVSTFFVPRFHSVNNENFIDIFCSKNLYFVWSLKLKVAEQREICAKLMKTLKPRQWLISVAVITYSRFCTFSRVHICQLCSYICWIWPIVLVSSTRISKSFL